MSPQPSPKTSSPYFWILSCLKVVILDVRGTVKTTKKSCQIVWSPFCPSWRFHSRLQTTLHLQFAVNLERPEPNLEQIWTLFGRGFYQHSDSVLTIEMHNKKTVLRRFRFWCHDCSCMKEHVTRSDYRKAELLQMFQFPFVFPKHDFARIIFLLIFPLPSSIARNCKEHEAIT